MGLQYSPVLSMTTCVQPHSTSHSPNRSKHWLVVSYLRISARASPLAGPVSTHTAIHFLPTSMPAQQSSTAEIIFASCPKRRPTLTTPQVVPRAEAQSRVRPTSAGPGLSSGLTPPLRRTFLAPGRFNYAF